VRTANISSGAPVNATFPQGHEPFKADILFDRRFEPVGAEAVAGEGTSS
jgi:hypothetical protein